ncbi:PadR family transcriptional regulator [Thalassobacillus devorans]|uniref:PadR family transcriptional regulator n=1 Tax=Thalassobacillus devorans TaxID=279813 RepID=UPI00048D7109|nr:PadR family transcriptional regulator [Thalassobacillus devorans]
MNTLQYSILSVLARKACSGYELVKHLEVLWPAKHSQIYPALTKLSKGGYVDYELVQQSGRPNKKIFETTEKGLSELKEWASIPFNDPAIKDEFLVKIYAIRLLEPEQAESLIKDRITFGKEKINRLMENMGEIEKDLHHDIDQTKEFGRYMLLERKVRLLKEEINWCHWVRDFVTKSIKFLLPVPISLGYMEALISEMLFLPQLLQVIF